MRGQNVAVPLVAIAAFPSACLANAAVPGALMHFGAMNTGIGIWWLVLSMLTCTVLEGFIFQIARVFRQPYVCSLALNGLSLVAGVPLAFAGAVFGDLMIMATVLSAVTEVVAAMAWRGQRTIGRATSSTRRTVLSVVGGNVVSNVALFILLGLMSYLYPPRWVYERECMRNIAYLRTAEMQYQVAVHATNGTAAAHDALLPYLPGKTWPVCPFGGTYQIGAVGQQPVCTHGPWDRPIQKRGTQSSSAGDVATREAPEE